MLADAEQFLLAVATGVAFGYIEWRFWRASMSRVALVLVSLYILQTFSQLAWRWFAGAANVGELITISALRFVFFCAAVLTVEALGRSSKGRPSK